MKTSKQLILLLFLPLTFHSFGQAADSTIWHLCAQLENKSVKAYSVRPPKGKPKNALVFKNNSTWDTLYLSNSYPPFGDSCGLEAVQLDGQGLDEIVITYTVSRSTISEYNEEIVHFTLKEFWNLDTREKIFMATTNYYCEITTTILALDANGTILDDKNEVDSDTCAYSCVLSINKLEGLVTIDTIKQTGKCPYNSLHKRNEGVYAYENGRMIWMGRKKATTK